MPETGDGTVFFLRPTSAPRERMSVLNNSRGSSMDGAGAGAVFPSTTDADIFSTHSDGARLKKSEKEGKGTELRPATSDTIWPSFRPWATIGAVLGVFPADVLSEAGRVRPTFNKFSFPVLISCLVVALQILFLAKTADELMNNIFDLTHEYGTTNYVTFTIYLVIEAVSGPIFAALTVLRTPSVIRALGSIDKAIAGRRKIAEQLAAANARGNPTIVERKVWDVIGTEATRQRKDPLVPKKAYLKFAAFFAVCAALLAVFPAWGATYEQRNRGHFFWAREAWAKPFMVLIVLTYKATVAWWLFFLLVTARACRGAYGDLGRLAVDFVSAGKNRSSSDEAIPVYMGNTDGKRTETPSPGFHEIRLNYGAMDSAWRQLLAALGPIIAAIVGLCGIDICLLTYVGATDVKLIAHDVIKVVRYIVIYGLTGAGCLIGLIAVSGAVDSITSSEADSLKPLKSVATSHMVEKDRMQFQQLLAESNAFSSNYSALGFFTVNKGMLITMANAMTTYLIVLLQFSENDQGSTTTVNPTSTETMSTMVAIDVAGSIKPRA